MKCAACMKPTKEGNSIKCSYLSCGKYHCSLCLNTNSFTPERRKTWKCPDCSASARKGGDNLLTSGSPGNTQNVTIRKRPDQLSPNPDQSGTDVKELTLELRNLTKQFGSLTSKLEEVTESLSHAHVRMDQIVDSLQATDARVKKLEQRDQEVITLKATVLELQSELNLQAQSRLRNEIEIAGIPEFQNEDLQRTVLLAATKLGVSLEEGELDFISRVGTRSALIAAGSPTLATKTPRPVVVRFLRRSKRDQVLKASKTHRNTKTSDLELPGVPAKVFFNERLTKQNRSLFWEARSRARSLGWFCWINLGTICVREREGKPAQAIRTPVDLDRVLPAASAVPTAPVVAST